MGALDAGEQLGENVPRGTFLVRWQPQPRRCAGQEGASAVARCNNLAPGINLISVWDRKMFHVEHSEKARMVKPPQRPQGPAKLGRTVIPFRLRSWEKCSTWNISTEATTEPNYALGCKETQQSRHPWLFRLPTAPGALRVEKMFHVEHSGRR